MCRDAHSDDEKLGFINSVECLMELPNKTPNSAAPGARSRYDDFIVTHINSTFHVHVDAVFFSWHRRIMFLFEQALREECRYGGYLPYMYWPRYAGNLTASSMFDGSPTSLGSDRSYNASNPNAPHGNYTPPAGQGGGCIMSGRFANLTGHFRNFPSPFEITVLPPDAVDYNPHCIRRNLNSAVMSNCNSRFDIERLLNKDNIIDFQHRIDTVFFPDGLNNADYGIHVVGHIAVGGDMIDFSASPSGPVFRVHHGMIDKLWTEWQARDPPHRQYALNGTNVFQYPPSAMAVDIDFMQSFGYLDDPWRLGDLMDVTRGPFCYRYE
jgi:tyrosinase